MAKRRNFYHRQSERRGHYCKHDCKIEKCQVCHEEQGALVEKVICSKNVQKTAEFALPFTLEAGPVADALLGLLAGVTNVKVTPNYKGIQQEVTVLKDKIINFGYIPATVDVTGTIAGLTNPSIPIKVLFQEHTDCPGVCPGDQVIETKPEVEAELNEPLISTGPNGTSLNFLLFKAVIRTHLTVVRTGIEKDGHICDLDSRRCDPRAESGTINTPLDLTPNMSTLPNNTPPTPPTPQ